MAKQSTDETKDSIQWNTPVPKELSEAAAARMSARGFNSKTEYVRSLIRADVERAAQEALEAKLVRAMKRSDFTEATPEFWEELKAELTGSD